MDIRIVEEDEIFKETVERYLDLKSAQNSINEELNKCLEEFQSYAGVDLESDFEGKVNLISGKMKVELEFKFNRSFDKKKLMELCKRTGKPAQTYANVKFEYPTKTMLKDMDTEMIDDINSCITTKRGKTSVSIDIK